MKKILFPSLLFFVLSGISLAQNQGAGPENSIVLEKHNLNVKIPEGWFSIVKRDPHFIASVASSENPKVDHAHYDLYFFALQKGFGLEDLMDRSAKAKAYLTRQNQLIKLGKQEEVELAGLKAREDMYMFTIGKQAYMFAIVGFERSGMGYVIDFWAPRNNKSRTEFSRFRDWLKNGISFIDPQKDLDSELKNRIQKMDEDSFKQNVPAAARGGNGLRSAQMKMAKDLKEKPEKFPSSPIYRLSKQAFLDEHAGKFREAKESYEKLLLAKDGTTAAFGESAWVMLHCAVQRTSEVTGDEARERQMLVWIRDNMLTERAPYSECLSGLLPDVQDHLRERLKKFAL